jgi:hypothetical protein
MISFRLIIDETARDTPKEESHLFNRIVKKFQTRAEADKFLFYRYGKKIRKTSQNGIYHDTINGGNKRIGSIYSYWNKNYSHNSNSWYQTDWIVLEQRETTTKYLPI